MIVPLKRDFTRTLVFQVLFFYSLLSCWVRTRVVAISLMKLTFPAACFLHVKNSCNWRNYLGQKLRVNTNLSSAYFVNIFQLSPCSFIHSDCKGYQKAGQATTICIPEKRTHQSRLFLQTGQKSVGGWFSAGNQREGGFLPSLTETLPLHQQPWEAFTAVLYSWGHFSRQNLPDRPGWDAAGRFSAQSPQWLNPIQVPLVVQGKRSKISVPDLVHWRGGGLPFC